MATNLQQMQQILHQQGSALEARRYLCLWKSNVTDKAETITLSLAVNNNQASQGNVFRPPLVGNMFDIDTILKDPISGGQAAIFSEGEMSFGMNIGDEMPSDMIKRSSDDLSAQFLTS